MQKSLKGIVCVAIALGLASCQPAAKKKLVSFVNMSDVSAASQLVAGFYELEANSWRWTAGKFAVTLQPPAGSDKTGARLKLSLFVPDVQVQKLGAITIQANLNDHPLAPETFDKPGTYEYLRDVPADSLRSNLVPVVFRLDKFAAPSTADGRELGVVVSAVGLQTK
jgi:hypothetical protein